MSILPREALLKIELAEHGGLDYAELETLGIKPDDVVDFSANLNPWGAPPTVANAVSSAVVSRYPDTEGAALRRALAQRLAVKVENLLLGNGSSELMWLLALAFLDPADRVLIVGPTFTEYDRVARIAGAEVRTVFSCASDDFRPKVAELVDVVSAWRPKLLFLCNPNNPTGVYLDRDSVGWLASHCPDTLLVLDEAYVGFVADPWSAVDLVPQGVLLLRSMTKDYGLAGLRLGYVVARPDIVTAMRKVRPPWNVNAVALEAGLACLSDDEFVNRCRIALAESKHYLANAIAALGLKVLPSATSFFLVEVSDAAACRAALLRRGLLVRDCQSFGLAGFIRIAARTVPQSERLVGEMTQLIRGGGITP